MKRFLPLLLVGVSCHSGRVPEPAQARAATGAAIPASADARSYRVD